MAHHFHSYEDGTDGLKSVSLFFGSEYVSCERRIFTEKLSTFLLNSIAEELNFRDELHGEDAVDLEYTLGSAFLSSLR
jgi:hypothetical protein